MQPQKPSLIQQFRALPRLAQIVLALVGVFLVIFVGSAAISGISAGFYGPGGPSQPTATSVSSSGTTPADVPTDAPVPAVQYPPQTLSDLQGLAALGDVNAIHEFRSENTGLATCSQPRRDVTVAPGVTGQQLAQDLLAYFYVQHLDNPCGSVVFAYHTQGESGNGYTAGRIKLDVTDSSGAPNVDPNATGLKFTLTLDVGDVGTGQEYIVTWQG